MQDLIDGLGGVDEIAARLTKATGKPVKPNAVYQWPYRNTIPHKHRVHVARWAVDEKLQLPDELQPYAPAGYKPAPRKPKVKAS